VGPASSGRCSRDYPEKVELVKIVNSSKEMWPSKSHVKWTFPAQGEPARICGALVRGRDASAGAPRNSRLIRRWSSRGERRKFPRQRVDVRRHQGKRSSSVATTPSSGPAPHPRGGATRRSKRPEQSIPQIARPPRTSFVLAAMGEKAVGFPPVSNFAKYAGPIDRKHAARRESPSALGEGRRNARMRPAEASDQDQGKRCSM